MNEDIYMGNLPAMNTDMYVDNLSNMNVEEIEAIMSMLQTLAPIFFIVSLISYLLLSYGLYAINTKLKEENAWLSFVPVINYYMYFVAGNNSFVKYFVYPLLLIFIGGLLSFVTFGISGIIAIIYYLYCWIKNLHSISLRTGRGVGTTLGFFFIPLIMFPLVGLTFKPTEEHLSNVGRTDGNKKKTIDEEIFEL